MGCASQAEGFGHYIVEAAGFGCMVVTTDGYPMKELLEKHVSLARPSNNIELNFSKQYTVNKDAIVEAAEKLDFKHYNRKIIDECVSNFHQRELKFSEGVKELASLFRKLIQTDHGSGIRAGG